MTGRIDRRTLLTAATVAPFTGMAGPSLAATAPDVDWGGPVVDCHAHLRDGAGNALHCDGCGVSHALLLTPVRDAAPVPAALAQRPDRFFWSASVDVSQPDAVEQLTAAVARGARGFGELKSHVQAGGPEMRRVYAAAAELDVPVLIHFQDIETRPGDSYNMGFQDFEAVLRAFPKTRFVGHANAFWAHVSNEPVTALNPGGPVKPGGLTDRLLSDYPNLFGDMAAFSGLNALSRDAEFTRGFLARHQDKLHFGSDCPCADGRGGSMSSTAAPAPRSPSGCLARATLAVLKASTPPAVFRKLTWDNGRRLFGLDTPARATVRLGD